jgi:cytochrome c oxidase subunit 3
MCRRALRKSAGLDKGGAALPRPFASESRQDARFRVVHRELVAMAQTQGAYYVPHGSHWPIVGSFGLLGTVGGAALWLNEADKFGKPIMTVGIVLLLVMMFGWFGTVIRESVSGMYNKQVDVSFRMGMLWFIFSEIMFFAAFFGALFYARMYSVPWLGGEGDGAGTNEFLWPQFSAAWPTNGPGDVGGTFMTMSAWGIPLLNTLLLLSSGVRGIAPSCWCSSP